ncbi:MAG: alpha/beta hydrolase [Balneolales bacterium]
MNAFKRTILTGFSLCIGFMQLNPSLLHAQHTQDLWPEAQGSEIPEADKPTLTVYFPEKEIANESAVIILPGGGYTNLAMEKEGYRVAERFNRMGITAVVLKYRRGVNYRHPVPLMDAQRAIRTVRHHAVQWNIDPNRTGILGFSAGGHLASTAGTFFDDGDSGSPDEIEQQSSRPDFMILVYPVISMVEDYTHAGSRFHLLGEDPDPALLDSMSSDTRVTAQTPPAFLIHGTNDQAVPVENSLSFYRALKNANVPVEMHLYENGPHGFGLAPDNPLLSGWPGLCETWLRNRGLLD